MDTFTSDQKIAMLVVPMLLFSMLGVSYASAYGRDLTPEEEVAIRKAHSLREGGDYDGAHHVLAASGVEELLFNAQELHRTTTEEQTASQLEYAIQRGDYQLFVSSLKNTPFEDSATTEVFAMLSKMYALHTRGKHAEAQTHFAQALYTEGSGHE